MERLQYFKRVVDLPTLKATGGTISFSGFTSGELWIALVTFLYVDFLDTTGTLFSMANFINNYVPGEINVLQTPLQVFNTLSHSADSIIVRAYMHADTIVCHITNHGVSPSMQLWLSHTDSVAMLVLWRRTEVVVGSFSYNFLPTSHAGYSPHCPRLALAHECLSASTGAGFVNEKKEFPRQTFAFCVDGISSVLGSLMGTSPIAAFIESASGIREGGRTGLTAICVSLWFFVALFFTPVLCEHPCPCINNCCWS